MDNIKTDRIPIKIKLKIHALCIWCFEGTSFKNLSDTFTRSFIYLALLHFRTPFFCWWFILKKHDLTLTVTLTLRRMQKCNSAIVLLSNFISADIIFHKFLPTSFNISLSKKYIYIYIYLCWIFLFSIYGQNLLSVTKVFCCVDAPALNETILSEQNC